MKPIYTVKDNTSLSYETNGWCAPVDNRTKLQQHLVSVIAERLVQSLVMIRVGWCARRVLEVRWTAPFDPQGFSQLDDTIGT